MSLLGMLAGRGQPGRDEPPSGIGTTPGAVNIRIPVRRSDHPAPDPPRQGDIRSRPAMVNIARFFHDQTLTQEDRFVAVIIGPQPFATYPRGGMAAEYPRANLRVPPHVAYGSLFTGNQ